MALKGKVESFGISEIFQLVSHQSKTGSLEIETSNGSARLRFLEGDLVEAWPDKRSPAELIGALLIRAGLITPVQLGHALDMQRQNLRRIGDILIGIGAVRVAEFREVLQLQHQETVYALLNLKRGKFRFVPEPVALEQGISVTQDLGALLMEGFRQIDEWPKLKAQVRSDRQVFGRALEATVPGDLSQAESRVLLLVNGAATVRDIIDLSRLGEFNAWEALVGLFERGLIKRVGTARRARANGKPIRSRRVVDGLVGLGLLGLTAGVILLFTSMDITTAPERMLTAWDGARQEAQTLDARTREWLSRKPTSWPKPDSHR